MGLYKDASGQLVVASSLPSGGSAVSGPATANLVDTAPWLRALDAPNDGGWHPAGYYNGANESLNLQKNAVYRQGGAVPAGVENDLWYVTSTTAGYVTGSLYVYKSGSWQLSADNTKAVSGGNGVNVFPVRYTTFEEATLPPLDAGVIANHGTWLLDATTSAIGLKSLKLIKTSQTANDYVFFGSVYYDYHWTLTPNKKWIFSCWMKSSVVGFPVQFFVRYAGDITADADSITITSTQWTRYSCVFDLSACNESKFIFVVDPHEFAVADLWFDGFMFEEQIGDLTIPSAYNEPPNFLTTFVGDLDATRNYTYRQATQPPSASENDTWYVTGSEGGYTPGFLYIYSSTSNLWMLASNNTYIDANGTIQGVSQNAGTVVDNTRIKANANIARAFSKWALANGCSVVSSDYAADKSALLIPYGVNFIATNFNVGPLLQNQDYVISFTAFSTVAGRVMSVDLFPDTLPQSSFSLTTTPTLYSAVWNSSHADMLLSTVRLRFWGEGQAGDIFICNVKLELSSLRTPWTPHALDVSNSVLEPSIQAAADAATAAQSSANTANSKLDDISLDSKLTADEKKTVQIEWAAIQGEKSGIDVRADAYGITTEKTAYGTAYTTLTNYINALNPSLNTLTTTTINRTDFKNSFSGLYTARQALLNKIAEVAGTRANWSGVSGTGKPADNANNTYIDANGTIQGVSQNAGTRVNNDLIKVGGTNFIKNSTTTTVGYIFSGSATISVQFTTLPDGSAGNVIKIAVGGSNSYMRIPSCVRGNETYSFSTWHKVESGSANVVTDVCDANGGSFISQTYWQQHKQENIVVTNWSSDVFNFIDLMIPANSTLYLWHPQMEYGNKASAWTPAPEDAQLPAKANLVRTFSKWSLGGGCSVVGFGNAADGYALRIPSGVDNISTGFIVGPLVQNKVYSMSFMAYSATAVRGLAVDLYPDTLPQSDYTLSTVPTQYHAVWSSAHADMTGSNVKVRFYGTSGDSDIYIYNVKFEGGAELTNWVPHSLDVANTSISINSNGTLTNGGTGQVTIGGLGYTGALNATYGADWGSSLTNRPANIASLAGTEQINNQLILLNSGANLIADDGFRSPAWWGMGNSFPAFIGAYDATNSVHPFRYLLISASGGNFDYFSNFVQLLPSKLYKVSLIMVLSSDFSGFIAPIVHFPNSSWACPGSTVADPYGNFPNGHTAASWGTSIWNLQTLTVGSNSSNYSAKFQTRICGRVSTGYAAFYLQVTPLFGDGTKIEAANVDTYIGNAAIKSAQIETLTAAKITTGTLSSQTITLGSGGVMNSGQSSFDSGTGFWLEGGAYPKLSLGNGSNVSGGKGLAWDTATGALTVRGDIISTSNITTNAVTEVRFAQNSGTNYQYIGNSLVDITGASLTVPTNSNRGKLLVQFDFWPYNNSFTGQWHVQILSSTNGGSTWDTTYGGNWYFENPTSNALGDQDFTSFWVYLSPSTSQIMFKMQARRSGTGSTYIRGFSLMVVEYKR